MKTLSLISLLITSIALAEELPHEFKKLKILHSKEIAKINAKYAKALTKLKKQYTTQGALEKALLVDRELSLITTTDGSDFLEGKPNISITTKNHVMVADVSNDAQRLIGYGGAPIKIVNDTIDGWKFLKTGWQQAQKLEVSFTKDSTIYIANIGEFKTPNPALRKTRTKAVITGPWFDSAQWFKIQGRDGHKFTCEGYECMIVAKEIHLAQ